MKSLRVLLCDAQTRALVCMRIKGKDTSGAEKRNVKNK
jgi:hypothetical protein